MTCIVAQDESGTVFQLVGHLDDHDFDDIETGFDRVMTHPDAVVVFDFAGLERVTASIAALMGVLRLQACRLGARMELRNLKPEVRQFLAATQR